MIADRLKNWRLYAGVAELKPAFEFLAAHRERVDPTAGRIEVDGQRLFVLPQVYQPKPIEQGRFEAHRRYLDIQYVASGIERMGYAPADGLETDVAYDSGKDIVFYRNPAEFSSLVVSAGSFAVFYPADAHMPGIRLGSYDEQVCKLMVKVLLP